MNIKDERKIGESEDGCDLQQVTTRWPRRKTVEEVDLKIKHCHWKFYRFIDLSFDLKYSIFTPVGECSVYYSVTIALSLVSSRYFEDLNFLCFITMK